MDDNFKFAKHGIGLLSTLLAVGLINGPAHAKNKLQLKSAAEVKSLTSTFKSVDPLQGLKEALDNVIDGDSMSITSVDVQGSVSIDPTGIKFVLTPDVSLPLAAWTLNMSVSTNYFNSATGQSINDDEMSCSSFKLVNAGPSVSISCGYKSRAHAANIAKSVTAIAGMRINHSANGTNYKAKGFLTATCVRANKTTVNLSCS